MGHSYGQEFKRGWRVVLGGAVGTGFGISALPFYTLGVFVKPIAEATGWSREDIQWGFAAMMIGMLFTSWIWGAAVDRFGARPVAMLSQIGLGISMAALPSFAGSLNSFYFGWVLIALVGAGTTPVTWTRGITGWFDKARGAALGLALVGTGFAGLLAPPAVTAIIGMAGWQAGYQVLGLSVLLVALPLVALLFRDAPRAADAAPLAGADRGEALRNYRFWVMLAVFTAVTFGVGGMIPNLVPLLTDRGLGAGEAALYAGFAGLAVITGRVVAGFLLDRFWAPAVATVFLVVPAVSCFLLAGSGLPPGPVIGLAAALIGLAAGAEFDLVAYMTSRYFGMKNYGFIYALQTVGMLLAGGIAPPIFGRIYDATGSYDTALTAAGAIFVVAPLLLLTMGRYPTETE